MLAPGWNNNYDELNRIEGGRFYNQSLECIEIQSKNARISSQ